MPPPDRRRWQALAVLALVQFTIVIDATVVNVALPTVGAEFGLSADGLAWVLNGYLVTAGGLLLLGGRLADVLGRRRMFLVGTVLFALASALCALAPTGAVLIVARFLQGTGEALASPSALSIIALLFSDPRERGT
ncbi:MAG: MFS transporter, partial [Pseudonocardiaceae bacterium]